MLPLASQGCINAFSEVAVRVIQTPGERDLISTSVHGQDALKIVVSVPCLQSNILS